MTSSRPQPLPSRSPAPATANSAKSASGGDPSTAATPAQTSGTATHHPRPAAAPATASATASATTTNAGAAVAGRSSEPTTALTGERTGAPACGHSAAAERHRPRPIQALAPHRRLGLQARRHRAATPPAAGGWRQQHQQLFAQLAESLESSARLHYRNALVCQNLALVHKVANRQSRRSGVAFEELCSAGYEGLIRAVECFDNGSGNAFSSFAVPHIHGAMLMDQRDRQQPLQTPRRLRELQRRSERLQEQRRAAGLPPLAAAALAEALGCSQQRLEEAGRVQQALQVRSLDQPLPGSQDEPGGPWVQELATAASAAGEANGIHDDAQLGWLRQQLQQLTSGDRELLEGRWIDGLSWSELGLRLGCSAQHCRRRALALIGRLQAMASQLQASIASTAAMAV